MFPHILVISSEILSFHQRWMNVQPLPPQNQSFKQSILILILAQTNCTAECLHTVVLRTTTTKQKCLFPYALRPPKCGFHFSLPITPKYFGTAVSLIISCILFWQHMTQIHGLVNFAWRALKNLLRTFPSASHHQQVYRIRFPWP